MTAPLQVLESSESAESRVLNDIGGSLWLCNILQQHAWAPSVTLDIFDIFDVFENQRLPKSIAAIAGSDGICVLIYANFIVFQMDREIYVWSSKMLGEKG